jgi:hypothetical protein
VKKTFIVAIAAAAVAGGCATPQAGTEEAAFSREYVTGSNIAKKKGEGDTAGVKMYSREALENSYRTGIFGNGQTPPGGGSGPGN